MNNDGTYQWPPQEPGNSNPTPKNPPNFKKLAGSILTLVIILAIVLTIEGTITLLGQKKKLQPHNPSV